MFPALTAPQFPAVTDLVGVFRPVGAVSDAVLDTVRRASIVAAVVAAGSLGLLGGRGEVVYPRRRPA